MQKGFRELLLTELRKSEIDEALYQFMASERPGIIYGAGRQARIVLDFCNMFGKKIVCLLTEKSKSRWGLLPTEAELPLYLLEQFSFFLDKSQHDVIIAVGAQGDEIEALLSSHGFSNVYKVDKWVAQNQAVRDLFYKAYLSYHGAEFLKDQAGDCYFSYRFGVRDFKMYFSEDDVFRSNTLGEFNDIVMPSVFDDMSLISALGPYELEDKVRLKKGDIVFDLGASVGLFSCVAAAKGCHVYAFEPAGYVAESYLARNVSLYDNIVIEKMAVTDQTGEIDFYVNNDLRANTDVCRNSIYPDKEPEFVRTQVPSITIDQYVKEHKIERLDFIKAFTEDAELLMLEGAEKTLKMLQPRLAIFVSSSNADAMERKILSINPRYHVERKWRRIFAYVE